MLLFPCLNTGGKAVDLFSADTGFKSHLSKLLKSSELQCLHPKVVMRITKLICYKILTPCHRIDGSMCMSFLVYLSDSDKSTKTYRERMESYSSLQLYS